MAKIRARPLYMNTAKLFTMKITLLLFPKIANEGREKRFRIFLFLLIFGTFSNISSAQSTSVNHMLTKTYKTETSVPILNPNLGQATTTITYLDGLGRPIQEVAHMQAGDNGDLVRHLEYNALGRQNKEFLPFVRSSASLGFDGNAAQNTASFYSSFDDGADTAYPWSQSVYENSAMNRILMQAAPGESWDIVP